MSTRDGLNVTTLGEANDALAAHADRLSRIENGGSISAVGDVTVASDSDVSGAGDIILKTSGVERARIKVDGTGTGWSSVLGGYPLPRSSAVMEIGDSITANGNVTVGSVRNAQMKSQSVMLWASMLSGGRVYFAGTRGVGGYTSADLLNIAQTDGNTLLQSILAAKPGVCVVCIGTNDIGGFTTASATTISTPLVTGLTATHAYQVGMNVTGTGIPASTTVLAVNSTTSITLSANATATGTPTLTFTVPLALSKTNLTSIYAQMLAANILPAPVTIPPRSTDTATNKASLSKLNLWITQHAASLGLAVGDYYTQSIDASTGDWTAGLNVDNFHPNGAGARIFGKLISDRLGGTAYLSLAGNAAPVMPPLQPYLVGNNSDTGNVNTNGLFLTDSGAPVGRPTGWTLNSGTSPTESIASDATTKGNYYSLTRGASDITMSTAAGVTSSPGDVIYFACRLGITVEATSSLVDLRVVNSDGTQDLMSMRDWDKDVPLGSIFAMQQVVPAGLSSTTWIVQLKVRTAAGAKIQIGQMTLYNLTTQSLLA